MARFDPLSEGGFPTLPSHKFQNTAELGPYTLSGWSCACTIADEYRVQMERSLDEVRQQTRQETEQELKKDFQAKLHARIEYLSEVEKEIERVRSQIEGVTKEITAMLDDPSVELSRDEKTNRARRTQSVLGRTPLFRWQKTGKNPRLKGAEPDSNQFAIASGVKVVKGRPDLLNRKPTAVNGLVDQI